MLFARQKGGGGGKRPKKKKKKKVPGKQRIFENVGVFFFPFAQSFFLRAFPMAAPLFPSLPPINK